MNRFLTFWFALALSLGSLQLQAQEVTLRAVSAFNEGGDISRHFERFVAKVNAEGKGIVRINFIGGPKAMPPFEVGKAVKSGVVDMAYVTGGFYTNVLPEALALNYTTLTGRQQREQGVWEAINKMWAEKMNVYYLARAVDHTPYHIFLNKKIDRLDLKGLRIRVTPIHQDIVVDLGAIAVNLPPGEVFTALERGLIDGYVWPLIGIFDLGWQEKTKFRVEPGFYSTEDSVLINLDKWKGLTKVQQDFLTKQAIWLEGIGDEYIAFNENEKKKQLAAGVQAITFKGSEASAFQKRALDVAWKTLLDKNPVSGRALKDKLDR